MFKTTILAIWPKSTIVTFSFFLLTLFSNAPCCFGAEPTPASDAEGCRQVREILTTQNDEISRELRLIKRELAFLKTAIEQPGTTEILGGIGYILGILGITLYWHARTLLKKIK